MKVERKKREWLQTQEALDCWTNSSCAYQKDCINMEEIYIHLMLWCKGWKIIQLITKSIKQKKGQKNS